jgi:hypothetical protein
MGTDTQTQTVGWTADLIEAHLWVGGSLQMQDGRAYFMPICGPHHWRTFEIPVATVKTLVRNNRIRKVCSHRPHRNVRYYNLP